MIESPTTNTWIRHVSRWPLRIIVGIFALTFAAVLQGTLRQDLARSPAPASPPIPSQTQIQPTPILRPAKPMVPIKSPRKTLSWAPRIYHIQWGDSLWAIANKFHVTVSELEQVNHLTSTTIYVNQTLTIPQTYVVKTHDTLNSIAHQFHVPLVVLWHENRLLTDKLHPGQTLIIPSTGQASASFQAHAPGPERSALPCSRENFRLLAHLVQAEAGNQPFIGQVAVAAVVLNRLKTPGFPKTMPQVIEEPGQFQSVSNGSIWQPANSIAYLAASAALKGWDPTHGALFFYNPSLPYDSWIATLPVTASIGQQVFCR